MKTFIVSLIGFFVLSFSATTLAETVVTEVGVPIVVENDTYTVARPDYYYYKGHRCYVTERRDISANFLGLRAGIGGGERIYCYPYP